MATSLLTTPGSASPELAYQLTRLDSLVDWERRLRAPGGQRVMRVDLEPIRAILTALENPERSFRAVHVAGTKGKGSVASLVATGLRRTGSRIGLYTSPHVERVQERVVVEGKPVDDADLARHLERVLDLCASPDAGEAQRATWFDALTATAFLAFRELGVEEAVIECGLGGRLDSTNVLAAPVCVLTNVELEHTAILGNTRAEIAAEKLAIVPPGGVLVSAAGRSEDEAGAVVAATARDVGFELQSVAPTDPGETIEAANVRLARAVLDVLGRTREGVGRDLLDEATCAAARLPGRFERLVADSEGGDAESGPGRLWVLDGAHVPGSLAAVLADARRDPELAGPPVVVFGAGAEKDATALLKVLVGRVDRVVCTSPGPGPYHDPEQLRVLAEELGLRAETAPTPDDAHRTAHALCSEHGWILVTGSLHLVGALRPPLTRPVRTQRC